MCHGNYENPYECLCLMWIQHLIFIRLSYWRSCLFSHVEKIKVYHYVTNNKLLLRILRTGHVSLFSVLKSWVR